MQLGFVIDHSRCIGCHACTVACKSENDVPLGDFRTWVKYTESGEFPDVRRDFAVLRCNQCTDAPCVEICPVTAIDKRASDGIVDIDPDICIGCKACMQGCPYDALYLNESKGTVQKCHFCAHRVEIGLAPACAVVCPTEAIIPGDFHDPASAVSQLKAGGDLVARKPEAGTNPNVLYREAAGAGLDPMRTNSSGGYLWAQQVNGVQMDAETFAALEARAQMGLSSTGCPTGNGTASTGAGQVPGAGAGIGNGGPFSVAATGAMPNNPAVRAAAVGEGGMARTVYNTEHPSPWGSKITGYLFFKSLAAGAFLAGAMLIAPFAAPETVPSWAPVGIPLIALAFLTFTMALLIADLKRPDRFYLILLRPNWNSWLAKGSFVLAAYSLLLTAWLAMGIFDYALPETAGWALVTVTAVAGALSAAYTGWLFAQAKGRVLWMKRGLWLHLLVQAVVAGSAVLLLLAPLASMDGASLSLLGNVLFGALSGHLFFILVEGRLSPAGREAEFHRVARLVSHGPFAQVHWAYGVGAGIVLPMVLLFVLNSALAWALAGLLALVGLYVEEDITVRAGQALPIS